MAHQTYLLHCFNLSSLAFVLNEGNKRTSIWRTSHRSNKKTHHSLASTCISYCAYCQASNLDSFRFYFLCLGGFVSFRFVQQFILSVVGWVEIILLSLYRIDITGLPWYSYCESEYLRLWIVWRLWFECCFRWFCTRYNQFDIESEDSEVYSNHDKKNCVLKRNFADHKIRIKIDWQTIKQHTHTHTGTTTRKSYPTDAYTVPQ